MLSFSFARGVTIVPQPRRISYERFGNIVSGSASSCERSDQSLFEVWLEQCAPFPTAGIRRTCPGMVIPCSLSMPQLPAPVLPFLQSRLWHCRPGASRVFEGCPPAATGTSRTAGPYSTKSCETRVACLGTRWADRCSRTAEEAGKIRCLCFFASADRNLLGAYRPCGRRNDRH